MFTAFMNLLVFSLFYLLYRFAKNKIYLTLEKEIPSSQHEWLILPVAVFIFAFVATRGFTYYTVIESSIEIPFTFSGFFQIPFKEVYLSWKSYAFYNTIFDQVNTYYQNSSYYHEVFIYELKEYSRLFFPMLILGFSVAIVNKTFKKSLLVMTATRLLLGLMVGEANIATALCLSWMAFLIAFLFYKILYRGLVRKNFIETFERSRLHRTVVVGYLVAMSLLPLFFVRYDDSNTSDKWSMFSSVDFDTPLKFSTFDNTINIRAQAFHLINKEALRIEFTLDQTPFLDILYKTDFESIELDYSLNDNPEIFGLTMSSGSNSFEVPFDRHYFYYASDPIKSIFPISIYGISAVRYNIVDKAFTDQIKVLDGKWWVTEDGYHCYTYTYQVPKIDPYVAQVGYSLSFDNPNTNKNKPYYNARAFATQTEPVKVDTTDAYDIYSIDSYFYDYTHGPLTKSQIHGLEQNFYSVSIKVDAKNKPTEPIWTIDSIDYFQPYLD